MATFDVIIPVIIDREGGYRFMRSRMTAVA